MMRIRLFDWLLVLMLFAMFEQNDIGSNTCHLNGASFASGIAGDANATCHLNSIGTSAFKCRFVSASREESERERESHLYGPFVFHPPLLSGSTDGNAVTAMLIEFILLLMRP